MKHTALLLAAGLAFSIPVAPAQAQQSMICTRSSSADSYGGSCYGRIAPKRVHVRRFKRGVYGRVATTYTAPWGTKVKAKIIRRALHISRAPGGHRTIHSRSAAWHWFNSHDNCYVPAAPGNENMTCRKGRLQVRRLSPTEMKVIRCGSEIIVVWAGSAGNPGGAIIGGAFCAWDHWSS